MLEALLNICAYDSQLEGDRAPWVIGMLDEAGTGDALYEAMMASAHEPTEGPYSFSVASQRGTFLSILSRRGLLGARAALERLFLACRRTHPDELLGVLDILFADGEAGLLHVCSVLGREAAQRDDGGPETWFLNVFDEERGEGSALAALEAARASDAGIIAFLEHCERREAEYETRAEASARSDDLLGPMPFGSDYELLPASPWELPVERVLEWIQRAPLREDPRTGWEVLSWLRRWGKKASPSSLETLARALDSTDSATEQQRILWVFSERPLPWVTDRIVAIAELDDVRIRRRAYWALRHIEDERVRSVGLRSLTPRLMVDGSLLLLRSNYKPSDHTAIERALFIHDEAESMGSLCYYLSKVCADEKREELLDVMLFVYEHSTGGLDRERVVETMHGLGVTPGWVAEECRYDAMEDIRSLFGGPRLDEETM